ncbi:winged helix-turn-helix transcriptional regulator [Candidatus Kaiserbacteria bacterium]|nr:winged helix-turn-helix transcriptional regulator [Candidatus Kaiserbacteria bacterium]
MKKAKKRNSIRAIKHLSPFPQETYERNALIYRILANHKRLEILNILKKRELTVEELRKALKIRKANLSQHLAILRAHYLVKVRRDGRNMYYTVRDPRIIEPCKILHQFWKKEV